MPRLLVCGIDFGWGSAGKLVAVLEALRTRNRDIEVTGVGTALGRRIIPPGLVDAWIDAVRDVIAEVRPDACLVVLDPAMADELSAMGCPVVYVDSLPYLWTEHDSLPSRVVCHCAQRSLPVPPAAERVLATLPTLTWVDPIVAPSLVRAATHPCEEDLLLVNIGGVHAPHAHGHAAADYLALVLRPLAVAAAERGAQRLLLAGNVAPCEVPRLDAMPVEQLDPSHAEFMLALGRARWIATSPGLTTLLEIAAIGRATAVLPPQNLSQFYHLRHVAAVVDPVFTVPWPTTLLDPDRVEAWHERGEEHAVACIYSAIAAAAGTPSNSLEEKLYRAAGKALDRCEEQPEALQTLAPSFDGATQVAERIEDVLGL